MQFEPPFPFNLVGSASDQTADHRECRRCGSNLPASVEECPECGGEAVVYSW